MIRWKQPRDMKGIVKLVRSQLVPKSSWQHPRDSRLYGEVAERLRNGSTLVAATNRSGDPIGFLHMVIQNRVLFVDLLAVDSSHQNRRVGTELMLRAEEYGRSKGCNKSFLYVDQENAKGLRFYTRLGYSNAQYVEALLCYRMEKKLDIAPGWIWYYAVGDGAQTSQPASGGGRRSSGRPDRQHEQSNGSSGSKSHTIKKPSEVIKQPAPTIKKPSEIIKQPNQTIKKPSEVIKQPSPTIKKPSEIIKQPAPTIKKPSEIIKKPNQTIKKPSEIIKKPAPTIKKPSEVIKKPNQTVPKPTPTFKKPAGTIKKPSLIKKPAGNRNPILGSDLDAADNGWLMRRI